ncbi:MAG: mechanosensitive ion channel [bacterium]|nr:mechanosensitive ion channel [bacterium]
MSVPAIAQETEPNQPVAGATAPPIPLSEIPTRAGRLEVELRGRQADAESADVEHGIADELPELVGEIEPELPALDLTLSGSPSLSDLDELTRRWNATEKTLSNRERRLRSRIDELEEQIVIFERLEEVWDKTQIEAKRQQAPEPLIADIEAILDGLSNIQDSFAGSRNEALILQSQVAELLGIASSTLSRIDATRERVVENILVRDRPPIWKVGLDHAGGEGLRANFAAWARGVRAALVEYREQRPELMVLHLAGLVVLAIVLFRVRSVVASERSESDPDREQVAVETARHTFDRPLAASLVLALVASPWIHTDAPMVLHDLAWVLLLLPLVLILRPLLVASLQPMLLALAFFYLTDQLRDILSDFPRLGRWIFAIEMALGALGLQWLLRKSRVAMLDQEASRFSLQAIALWMRLSLLAFALALVGAILGYTSAADLIGNAVLGSMYLALGLYAGVRISEGVAVALVRSPRIRASSALIRRHGEVMLRRIRFVLITVAMLAWLYSVTGTVALRDPAAAMLASIANLSIGYGTFSLAVGDLASFGFTLWVAWLLARLLRTVLEDEVYPRISLPRGVPFALSTIGSYTVLLLGFVVALSALGFDLDRVTILLGAFGVGIGFGLQNIVNNFVSGLILLFERPIQVGDRIQLGDVLGRVSRIGIRASTVRTLEGADVIVPNAQLVSDQLVNWTFADRKRRIELTVGVAYGTDPDRVIELLGSAAEQHRELLNDPPLEVYFMGFGDSSLDFSLRGWTAEGEDWIRIRSELGVAVNQALADAGIEIPFPQRDLHLRTTPAG